MNDCELLELAAKAAGINVIRSRLEDPMSNDLLVKQSGRNPFQAVGSWNPLSDDGDALRLAIRLRINIEHMKTLGGQDFGVNCWPVGRGDCGTTEEGDLSNYASITRRAIVRAAAEIGRQMQEGGAA